MLCLELGSDMKYVQMFHSMTTDEVKEEIRKDMSVSNGTVRILVASSAAGMGVNFKGLNSIIHFGPPKTWTALYSSLAGQIEMGLRQWHFFYLMENNVEMLM